MSDPLLPFQESLECPSPKLVWLKKHGILLFHHCPPHDTPKWFAGLQAWWPELYGASFFAQETARNGASRIGEGETQEEAMLAFCQNSGIKHYTLET